jgi:hypothetical protein
MQETLSQLSELNDTAISENVRAAQRLADDDWVAVDDKAQA